jgi:hypothetical protein
MAYSPAYWHERRTVRECIAQRDWKSGDDANAGEAKVHHIRIGSKTERRSPSDRAKNALKLSLSFFAMGCRLADVIFGKYFATK